MPACLPLTLLPPFAADMMPVKRALLSVSDKSNLAEFGKFLASKGVELLSTGGTAAAALAHGAPLAQRRRRGR